MSVKDKRHKLKIKSYLPLALKTHLAKTVKTIKNVFMVLIVIFHWIFVITDLFSKNKANIKPRGVNENELNPLSVR